MPDHLRPEIWQVSEKNVALMQEAVFLAGEFNHIFQVYQVFYIINLKLLYIFSFSSRGSAVFLNLFIDQPCRYCVFCKNVYVMQKMDTFLHNQIHSILLTEQ